MAGEASLEGAVQFFDGGSQDAYSRFKRLLQADTLDGVAGAALEAVELMELGKIKKGAIGMKEKHMSRNERWFSRGKSGSGSGGAGGGGGDSHKAIGRDSLIKLHCKRGKGETAAEYYRVLALFTKFSNKWFVAEEEELEWPSSKDGRVLARMMRKQGSTYREVRLEAGGAWGAKQVYTIAHFRDILELECSLVPA